MLQIGGKPKKTSSDSKRHFTVVMGNKEHGLYVSSTPSSAARKAVTKLCTANKSKKVEFYIREITQGSKKKTYGPYEGYIEKLKEPIELKGRVIKYKPVAKLSGKSGSKKGGQRGGGIYMIVKCKSVGSENKLANATYICQELKTSLQSNRSIDLNSYGEIKDLDDGESFKILLNAKGEKYFRLLKVAVDENIDKISKNLRVDARSVASVEVYNINNANGSINTWNTKNFRWIKPKPKSSNNAGL
jgi:hypothetical protein